MIESYRGASRILLVAFLAGLAPAAAAPAATRATPAAASRPAAAADPLPRRAFLGTPVGPVSATTRARQKLGDSTGVEIRGVLPGSSAEAAKLRPGDVVVQVDGTPVTAPAEFIRAIASRKGAASVQLTYWRDGARRNQRIALKPMPLETSDSYDVQYGSVPSSAGRLRLIWTRPRGAVTTRRPALLLLQGIGTFSMENVPATPGGYAAIIDDFTRRGYVTLRVDKPGCGDSEGGPLQDVDFDTQLDGFRQALRALKADPQVDPDRVLLFGHSMGGVWGPLLAEEIPVRGIAVYGTLARTWLEYMLENNRRQSELGGVPPAAVDSALWYDADATYWLNRAGLAPREAIGKEPALRRWVDSSLTHETYYGGLHYRFVQQLAAKNLGAAWTEFPGYALALWGRADFISGEEDHRLIARIVSRAHPGHGEFMALDGIDHGFYRAADQKESFEKWGRPGAEFNPEIIAALREWSDRVAARTGD
jgi:pimeloyl-ACP methyl ester carboxylesterase